MEKIAFNSVCLQFYYDRGAYTGDGFKIRISTGKIGLIIRIYWGPYRDSRHVIFFVGIDRGKLLERRVDKMMKNLSPQKRLAIMKSLLEINQKTPNKRIHEDAQKDAHLWR